MFALVVAMVSLIAFPSSGAFILPIPERSSHESVCSHAEYGRQCSNRTPGYQCWLLSNGEAVASVPAIVGIAVGMML